MQNTTFFFSLNKAVEGGRDVLKRNKLQPTENYSMLKIHMAIFPSATLY